MLFEEGSGKRSSFVIPDAIAALCSLASSSLLEEHLPVFIARMYGDGVATYKRILSAYDYINLANDVHSPEKISIKSFQDVICDCIAFRNHQRRRRRRRRHFCFIILALHGKEMYFA